MNKSNAKINQAGTNGFEIGSFRSFSDDWMQALIRELQKPPEAAQNQLAGRMRPHVFECEDFGRVVIKHYFRGGILRHVNRRTYVKTGKTRSHAEFNMLRHVRNIGINAPLPVAFASKTFGRVFYHAWLVTKEIPGAHTLAALSRSVPGRAEAVLPETATQINTLIRNGVLHVDLHPGNILVDAENRVYVIDFDKAEIGGKNEAVLAGYYLRRWERAVFKHALPLFLQEQIKKAVRHG